MAIRKKPDPIIKLEPKDSKPFTKKDLINHSNQIESNQIVGGKRATGCVRAREAKRTCVERGSVKTFSVCHVPRRDSDPCIEYGMNVCGATATEANV